VRQKEVPPALVVLVGPSLTATRSRLSCQSATQMSKNNRPTTLVSHRHVQDRISPGCGRPPRFASNDPPVFSQCLLGGLYICSATVFFFVRPSGRPAGQLGHLAPVSQPQLLRLLSKSQTAWPFPMRLSCETKVATFLMASTCSSKYSPSMKSVREGSPASSATRWTSTSFS